MQKMALMTRGIADKMPMLYSTEKVDVPDKIVQVKYFLLETSFTWYGVEACTWDGDDEHNRPLRYWTPGQDVLFFGLVDMHESEWGYFTLKQLEPLRSPMLKLPIERDLSFPKPMSEVSR